MRLRAWRPTRRRCCGYATVRSPRSARSGVRGQARRAHRLRGCFLLTSPGNSASQICCTLLQGRFPHQGLRWYSAFRRLRLKASRCARSISRCRSRRACRLSRSSASPTRGFRKRANGCRAALIASGLALPAHRITINLADIKGQESAKRALEIAAAGGHNLLMVGPPSAGKSMLARLPSILPPLAPSELLEVSMVASVAGEGGALTGDLFARRIIPPACPLWRRRFACAAGRGVACPSRRFVSRRAAGIPAAGARFAAPAAETGEVSIARANHRVTYPARFMLVAAMNPCRCGKVSEPGFAIRRGPNTCCAAYQARISGPLIDRIDLHIEVPAVTADLILPPPAEPACGCGPAWRTKIGGQQFDCAQA